MTEFAYIGSCLTSNPEKDKIVFNFQHIQGIDIACPDSTLDSRNYRRGLVYRTGKFIADLPHTFFRNIYMEAHKTDVFLG
jgi:hypothetical protein